MKAQLDVAPEPGGQRVASRLPGAASQGAAFRREHADGDRVSEGMPEEEEGKDEERGERAQATASHGRV